MDLWPSKDQSCLKIICINTNGDPYINTLPIYISTSTYISLPISTYITGMIIGEIKFTEVEITVSYIVGRLL